MKSEFYVGRTVYTMLTINTSANTWTSYSSWQALNTQAFRQRGANLRKFFFGSKEYKPNFSFIGMVKILQL